MKPTSEKEKEKKRLDESLSVRQERLQAATHHKGREAGWAEDQPRGSFEGLLNRILGQDGEGAVDGPERHA